MSLVGSGGPVWLFDLFFLLSKFFVVLGWL